MRFPCGRFILFERLGGQYVMRAEVAGVCDGDITGPSAGSSQRASFILVKPTQHEFEIHRVRDRVPYAATSSSSPFT